ncbi:SURF1 family protein [Aquamicrobium zhengzhouense]|uniref:SURF1-like protein n=1 Tax=Aquamicrobium zhengzhouense TaxID=2781738 RepID=A0ABS0SFC5_9HYPH|nr:SURF1 family protein [Aquamicrobium zhengzhouense]MBI1621993.1 SURF1 family protein [Aquamicrobium zhengzhouense]
MSDTQVQNRWTLGSIVFVGGVLVALVILLGLGTWQMQRLGWKEALISTIDQRVASEPRSLEEIEGFLTTGNDVDYWPVKVEGVFHHDGERHFFATHEGRAGFYVYTPLELTDGRLVLVNRGFVPYELKEPSTRVQGQVEGIVNVTGLARAELDGKPSVIVPDNDLTKNVFYWKDLQAMAETTGVGQPEDYLRLFIDANDTANPGGLPVGGVTMISLPNSHLEYALTWYSLAAVLVGVLGVWVVRQRKT